MHCVTSNVIRCSYRPERGLEEIQESTGARRVHTVSWRESFCLNSEKRKEDSSCKVMSGVDSEDLRFGELKPDIPPHAVRSQSLY